MEESIQKAISRIKKAERVRIICQYDADGISAGAIALKMLLREGKNIHLSTIKQVKKEVVEDLKKEDNDLIIFVDVGAGYLDLLSEIDSDIIISDHHQPIGEVSDRIVHINPRLFDFDEKEMSGAGVTYQLAKSLNPDNKDLSFMVIVGAIGDIQEEGWTLSGINDHVLKEAESVGVVELQKGIRLFGRNSRPVFKALEYSTEPYIPGVTGNAEAAKAFMKDIGISPFKEGGGLTTLNDLTEEQMQMLNDTVIKERIRDGQENPEDIFGNVYTLNKMPDDLKDGREVATALNACGRMEQASVGIMSLLGDKDSQEKMNGVLNGYRRMISKYMKWLRGDEKDIHQTDSALYILGKDSVSENFIGTITTIASKSNLFGEKPIISYAYGANEIKLSGRANEDVVKKGVNLGSLFDILTDKLGGTGGGHHGAGGAFVPLDKEDMIIPTCEEYFKYINTS